MDEYLFSSESVSEGHPDKIADQISDAILDAILEEDPVARVACETLCCAGLVILSGEITTKAHVSYLEIVRNTLYEIGYADPELGFDGATCSILTTLNRQSSDIAQGVNEGEGIDLEQGAGDQGIVFGYACQETPQLMPLPIYYAHRLMERQSSLRKSGEYPFLRPDAKSQLSVRYLEGIPKQIETVVLSTQHAPTISHASLTEFVIEEIIKPVLPSQLLVENLRYLVNPTGRFVLGGPVGDCGLTGRKIIVDTYGGAARHGGGAFSGKDPSKVDRSGAYACRYVAKNIVAAGLASRCEVQVAYAIGVARPVSLMVNTFGTGVLSDEAIGKLIGQHFDLRPKAIIQHLNLLRPIYKKTSVYGHFGRELTEFSWEKTDKVALLRDAARLKGEPQSCLAFSQP